MPSNAQDDQLLLGRAVSGRDALSGKERGERLVQRMERRPLSLVKMHGDAEHPPSIVLTREDYMRYNDSREALSGAVESGCVRARSSTVAS